MTFSPTLRLYGEAADEDLPRQPCSIIDIAVVRLDGPKIRGTLAPYWDPDCDCRTLTVFEGELSGQRVQGSFTSKALLMDGGSPSGGRICSTALASICRPNSPNSPKRPPLKGRV